MKIGAAMFFTDYSMSPGELAVALEERGFDSLWAPEHSHIPLARTASYPGGGALPREYYEVMDPFVTLTAAAAATKKLLVGTGICLVVQRDPIQTAKAVATIDHISGGRFLFGVGNGWNQDEIENHGTVFASRHKLARERIEAMKAIWTQAQPSYAGEFVNFTPMETGPKPLQKPHPPIHISISSPDSASAKLAGAKGWGIISGPIAPLYAVAAHWQAYSEARRQAGKAARSEDWRVSRLVIVAPTDAEAAERVYGECASNRYYCSYMRTALATAKRLSMIKPRAEMTDEECTPEAIMNDCVIHGSPRTVLDKLVALRERVGPFGTLLQIGLDWGGPNEAWERDGMRLLAHEVMPKFRQHVTAQAAE